MTVGREDGTMADDEPSESSRFEWLDDDGRSQLAADLRMLNSVNPLLRVAVGQMMERWSQAMVRVWLRPDASEVMSRYMSGEAVLAFVEGKVWVLPAENVRLPDLGDGG
jgi:hypothetical protein